MAYATLNEDAASPLEPEAEARLQALLAERVAPLLTRCLQAWKAGARRPAGPPPGRAGAAPLTRPPAAGPPEGQRRVPDAVACLASNALGNLLSDSPLCKRMPGKEHIRGVRVLYTLLQWTAERIAELVRVRGARLQRPEPGGHRRILRPAASCARSRSGGG